MDSEIRFVLRGEGEMIFGFFIGPSKKQRERLAPVHPELDFPDDEIPWKQWLEGRARLETALLLGAT